MNLIRQELKINLKNFLLWSLSVGLLCLGCILIYDSMAGSLEEIAESFSQMGNFSVALGMDKISLATMEGYYATEIAIMLSLGGAMYAAMVGGSLIAKEEEGHTSEYLVTLPISRMQILFEKYLAMILLILFFNVVCFLCCQTGFVIMDTEMELSMLLLFQFGQFCMQLEIGSIAFLISAVVRKKPIGACLGIALVFYMVDLMCRIVPIIEWMKYITPFYYSNGSDVFVAREIDGPLLAISLVVTVLCFVGSIFIYQKKDITA